MINIPTYAAVILHFAWKAVRVSSGRDFEIANEVISLFEKFLLEQSRPHRRVHYNDFLTKALELFSEQWHSKVFPGDF